MTIPSLSTLSSPARSLLRDHCLAWILVVASIVGNLLLAYQSYLASGGSQPREFGSCKNEAISQDFYHSRLVSAVIGFELVVCVVVLARR